MPNKTFYARLLLSIASVASLVLLALWFRGDHQTRPRLISAPIQAARAGAPPPLAASIAATDTQIKKAGPAKTLEICGIGNVSDDDDGRAEGSKAVNQKLEQARKRWLAAMLQSSDPRVLATGLLFEGRLT